jgi:hypothetical protein
VPFAAALLARVPTQLLGSYPQRVELRPAVDRIFSLKTCAAHITHEGRLAVLLINAHDAASLLDRLTASTMATAGMGVIDQKQQIDDVRAMSA